mmetsp:Transcript_10636/g.47925  ORF Transcript_10636/g.47925 Transcript_10636/m.47925 type:complete len:544 (+) Transcript_10636:3420-5051(+)
MASTAEEISSATPEPPPPLPAPRPPPPPRAKSERQDLWPVRDVRDRLLGGKSPKLTKTTVISRLRAVCGAEALARRDLRGATVSAAKRVSASKLADLYAELHDELTRRRKEPGRIDEDDVEGNGDGDGDGKVETPTVPNPSPPAEGARVEEDAWALYWELLRAGVGGEGRGPPEPAPIRALAPSAASGDIDERPPPGSSLIASSCIARGGGRDPTAAAAAVALLSALHRRFGPVGGSTAWENSRVAQKLQAQLEDAVAVASGAVPAWTHTLLRGAWFLFPLEARLRHFHSTAFGTSRSVTWVQEQAGAGGGVGGGGAPRAGQRVGLQRGRRVNCDAGELEPAARAVHEPSQLVPLPQLLAGLFLSLNRDLEGHPHRATPPAARRADGHAGVSAAGATLAVVAPSRALALRPPRALAVAARLPRPVFAPVARGAPEPELLQASGGDEAREDHARGERLVGEPLRVSHVRSGDGGARSAPAPPREPDGRRGRDRRDSGGVEPPAMLFATRECCRSGPGRPGDRRPAQRRGVRRGCEGHIGTRERR